MLLIKGNATHMWAYYGFFGNYCFVWMIFDLYIFSQCVVSDEIWQLAMRFTKEEMLSEILNKLLPIECKIIFLGVISRIFNFKSLQSEGACFLF
jgi:hypothetical protein